MTKNKSVDLGIDTFMQSVAENKPAATVHIGCSYRKGKCCHAG